MLLKLLYLALQLTPLAASYLKGHSGLTYYLLDLPDININFQDDAGQKDYCNPIVLVFYEFNLEILF